MPGCRRAPSWPGIYEQLLLARRGLPSNCSNGGACIDDSFLPNPGRLQCSASWRNISLRYVVIYKSDSVGLCTQLSQLHDHSKPARSIVFTFVREPLGRFVSGFTEFSYRGALRHFDLLPQLSRRSYASAFRDPRRLPRALIETFVNGQLGCTDVEAHMHSQTAFLVNAMEQPHMNITQRGLDFIGRIESGTIDWDAFGKLVLSAAEQLKRDSAADPDVGKPRWPPYRDTRTLGGRAYKHGPTDSASNNTYRGNMTALLNGDGAVATAVCRLLLPDFVCFGYELPPACASATPPLAGALQCEISSLLDRALARPRAPLVLPPPPTAESSATADATRWRHGKEQPNRSRAARRSRLFHENISSSSTCSRSCLPQDSQV